jgi:hypothetical protein
MLFAINANTHTHNSYMPCMYTALPKKKLNSNSRFIMFSFSMQKFMRINFKFEYDLRL